MDLVTLFPQHDWLFPSEAYRATQAGSPKAWRTLFKALGVTDFIQAPLVPLTLTPQQKATSLWATADLGPPDPSVNYLVQDRSASEFQSLLQSLHRRCKDRDVLQLHCGHLAHHIDALWEAEYGACAVLQVGAPSSDGEKNNVAFSTM